MVYINCLGLNLMLIYLIKKAKIALLFTKKVKILARYLDFLDIFWEKKALGLRKLTKFNQHIIKLQNSKQLFYKLIYRLESVKLKTLKIYIDTNLANGFI